MAKLRDFDPELMKDGMDALIHYAEGTAMEALGSKLILGDWERGEIAQALIGIRPAVNALVRFIPHLNPETENGFLVVLGTLMADMMTIGSASTYMPNAQAHLEQVRASIMRMKYSGDAKTKNDGIRAAILEVCKGMALIGTDKFAELIRPAVCKKLGVKTNAKGYSPRTIRRVIEAILKECGNS